MRSTRSASESKRANRLSAADIVFIRKAILRWGQAHRTEYPWRRDDVPAWQKLVAEVMLVRTKADQVVPIWEEFVSRFPTASCLSTMSLQEVQDMAAPLGLRWRAVRLHQLLMVLAESKGVVPTDPKEIKALPGVGDYCAAAFLSLHGATRATIVDSNVVRLLSRISGKPFDGETRRQAWLLDMVEQLTPDKRHTEFNHAVLDLGMSVCLPRPDCPACPLSRKCQWRISAGKAQTGQRSSSHNI